MKTSLTAIVTLTLAMAAMQHAHAVVIWSEDFENGYAQIDQTQSDLAYLNNEEYFDIVNNSNTFSNYVNVTGNFFGIGQVSPNIVSTGADLVFKGIDVSNYTNLQISMDVASVHGAGASDFVNQLSVYTDTSTTEGGLTFDTSAADLDLFRYAPEPHTLIINQPTGPLVIAVFETYTESIVKSGDTLQIEITAVMNDLLSDLAIDNITLTGDPIPEPTTMALLGLGGAALAYRRRRKA